MGLIPGNPDMERSIFEQIPELNYVPEFADLKNRLGEGMASRVLWSIRMIEDPNSKTFRMPFSQKIDQIQATYFPDFDYEQYKDVARKFSLVCLEKEEQLYSIQVRKLDELTEVMDKLDTDNDKEFAKYIKIIDKLPKAWDALEKVKKRMIDKADSQVKGGGKSHRESR